MAQPTKKPRKTGVKAKRVTLSGGLKKARQFIKRFKVSKGYYPTVKDLSTGMKIAVPKAQYTIEHLADCGVVIKNPINGTISEAL
jgi:hypothetical protein